MKLIFGEDFSYTRETMKEGRNIIRVDQSVIDYCFAITKKLTTEVSEGIICALSLKRTTQSFCLICIIAV